MSYNNIHTLTKGYMALVNIYIYIYREREREREKERKKEVERYNGGKRDRVGGRESGYKIVL